MSSKKNKNFDKGMENKSSAANRKYETFTTTAKTAKDASERAHSIVLRLIEYTPSAEELSKLVLNLSRDHYCDITEERSLTGLCGYPFCNEKFVDEFGDRQYIIRNNNVYDITDRRKFCSNVCFEASGLIALQISDEPLYLRSSSVDIKPVLIPDLRQLKGQKGKKVNIKGAVLDCDLKDFEKQKNTNATQNISAPQVKKIVKESLNINSNKSKESNEQFKEPERSQSKTESMHKNDEENTDKLSKKKEESREDRIAPVLEVETTLRDWSTLESITTMLGVTIVKDLLQARGAAYENLLQSEGSAEMVDMQSKYLALCKSLDHQEEFEQQLDEDEEETQELEADDSKVRSKQMKKPVPEYKKLQKDLHEQTLKVRAFITGQVDTLANQNAPSNEEPPRGLARKIREKFPDAAETADPVLPLVDEHEQVEWRRRIVLEKLNKMLPELLQICAVSEESVRRALLRLVANFNLTPHNLSLRPGQWGLVSLAVLKMLSIRNEEVRLGMSSNEGEQFVRLTLEAFGLDPGYLDRLISYITEIDHLLAKKGVSLVPSSKQQEVEVEAQQMNEGTHMEELD